MPNKISYHYHTLLFAFILSSNTALIVSGIIIYLLGITHALHQTVVKRIPYWVADCVYRHFGYCARCE